MEGLFTSENLVAFLTLTALEIVLGIDNVIFISILSAKLPVDQQKIARQTGIGLAVVSRVLLLFAINWVQTLEGTTLFAIGENTISGKDIVLLIGGAFLIGKSTYEIHEKLEVEDKHKHEGGGKATLQAMLVQVLIVDVVFSLDSVITAVGIADSLIVMITAIIIAAAIMVFFSGFVSDFVEKHPTMKILALAFLILIGSLLVIEGWNPEAAHDLHLKNYIYFAMAFSFFVEVVNIRFRTSKDPVKLHNRPKPPAPANKRPQKAKKA